jgi:hypothetical protein
MGEPLAYPGRRWEHCSSVLASLAMMPSVQDKASWHNALLKSKMGRNGQLRLGKCCKGLQSSGYPGKLMKGFTPANA